MVTDKERKEWIMKLEREVKELTEDLQVVNNETTVDILVRYINRLEKLIKKYK